jgi:beta-glucosidase
MMLRTTVTLLLFALSFSATASEEPARAHYIANMGAMVERGTTKVLFDPLFYYDRDTYDRVPAEFETALLAGSKPFDGVDAVFISHLHGDHVDPATVLKLLRAQPAIELFGPEQAAAAIRELVADANDPLLGRIHGLSLANGETAADIELGPLLIEAARIPHEGWPDYHPSVENLVFRVTLDGDTTVMHFGDAGPMDEHFARDPAHWRERHTHLAMPPYWFFLSDAGRRILDQRIRVGSAVGMHVPTDVADDPADRRERLRDVDLFTRPGETRTIRVGADGLTPGTEQRVDAILKQMTTEEKIDLLAGVDFFYLRGVPRLGVPRLRMIDGPMGVRNDGPATAFPGGIALAATWNTELAQQIGVEFGRDSRAKGAHFLLAPGVNIYRSPVTGRNFEYLGEDPYLAGRIAVGFINGVQSQGVSATVKHFAANNSEFDRNNTDSVVDERTLREIYLPAFEAAVKDGKVGAIMDGYNLVNGHYMSQHAYLNNDVAKGEWGFDGVIMSDWIATYDAIGMANGGLDIEMPYPTHFNRETLLPALESGAISQATLDDKVRRILRVAERFGWLDRDQLDRSIPRYNLAGRQAALQGAREGTVLLKNDAGLLPLDSAAVKTVLVVGPNVHPAVVGAGGSSKTEPFTSVSILEGVAAMTGSDTTVLHDSGIPSLADMVRNTHFTTDAAGGTPGMNAEYFASDDLSGDPVITRVEPRPEIGLGPSFPPDTASERWTGYYTTDNAGRYDIVVAAAGDRGGYYRVLINDELVFDSWTLNKAIVDYVTLELAAGVHKVVLEHRGRQKWPGDRMQLAISRHGDRVSAAAQAMAAAADVIVIAAGFDDSTESEGADRSFRLPPGQDELIATMLAANTNTIVVMTAGGAVDMNAWIDDVPALLQAWYPGEEGGTAIAEILFGAVNPSGRLPATFERRLEDNPSYASYYPRPGTLEVDYEDGIFVGYRGYDANDIDPLFPFGHGLSYTSFEYSDLSISPDSTSDGRVTVSFDLTNTGDRAGAEVAQVYVADAHTTVPRPPKELKGFAKISLQPGENQRVSVELDRRAFAYYDVAARDWQVTPGTFRILIGSSSRDIALRGDLAYAD